MNILISGDFFISDDFQNKDIIDKSVIDLFKQADYRIVNLEGPLTENIYKNQILKTGPHLRMSHDIVIPYLKQLNIDCVTLANNHILDYGPKGLTDTFESLHRSQINYVGAGIKLDDANKPLTIEKCGLRIAIINFCENEWSTAKNNSPGANPMDIIDNSRQIKKAKDSHDKVICIIHGGHEYYQYPTPHMQKQYRFYVDNGADIILGHHTHCIGGYEIYNDVPIIYSLGNFLFTRTSKKDMWYEGFLCVLNIQKEKKIQFELFTSSQNKRDFKVRITDDNLKQTILNNFKEISTIINKEELLNDKWEKYVQNSKFYLNYISPTNAIGNRYLRSAFSRLGLNRLFLNNRYLINLLNVIRCESHANLLNELLTKQVNEKVRTQE